MSTEYWHKPGPVPKAKVNIRTAEAAQIGFGTPRVTGAPALSAACSRLVRPPAQQHMHNVERRSNGGFGETGMKMVDRERHCMAQVDVR